MAPALTGGAWCCEFPDGPRPYGRGWCCEFPDGPRPYGRGWCWDSAPPVRAGIAVIVSEEVPMALDKLKFAIEEEEAPRTCIRVFGVGGGGSNAVTRMLNDGLA